MAQQLQRFHQNNQRRKEYFSPSSESGSFCRVRCSKDTIIPVIPSKKTAVDIDWPACRQGGFKQLFSNRYGFSFNLFVREKAVVIK